MGVARSRLERLSWVVRDLSSGTIAGTTRYHDIVRDIDRVEIGYTWYGARWQRSHVNSACKLLLLTQRSRRSVAKSSV
jgi:RimJ/RimL family protein N-acetyltransferase